MRYKFCPQCGTKLISKDAGDDGKVPFCASCERLWFPTFSDCVIVLVANEFDEIVLAKMPYLSHQYASLISGYMQPGETAETAAKREVAEELGIVLKGVTYTGTYWFDKTETLIHGFIGKTKKCELRLSKELASAEWIASSDAPQYMFPDSPENAALAVYKKYIYQHTDAQRV
ncbi:NAD(+) diphosphatase [Lapidilactobacillus mulanensis]|uniref:NAD(+) diphosphatase n=1 Tax=Lapidilactobacillus mulanensis TaxID=2485999 RepID=A0ABW4DPC1_9LACO|nr:NUDIX domain-containing protein [Lapidilactobacillus mulanensis]